MIRVPVEELQPGMKLARTLHYEYGGIMLQAGSVLETSLIERLKKFGFRSVYVYDRDTADIVVYDTLDERTRSEITRHVNTLFNALREETKSQFTPEEIYEGASTEVRRKIHGPRMRKMLDRMKIKETFLKDLDNILDNILSDDKLCLSVGTIKSNQSRVYDHSIEVTTHAAIIGKRLGFTRSELHEMLMGALLHDIGYIFLPEDILLKTKPHTDREVDLLKQHTIFGYYLLRERPEVGLLSAHIAYQHHERQDGRGYPRRLKGLNRILRPNETITDTGGLTHRYADVVAVPNLYDNMISTHPNRPAIPPEKAVTILKKAAGTALNREVVDTFLSYLPVFPVGTQVSVTGGSYSGFRGVVVRVHPGELDKPVLRLTRDQSRVLTEPIEVDLRTAEDVPLRANWK